MDRLSKLRPVISWAAIGVVVLFAVLALRSTWSEVADSLGDIAVLDLVAASLLVVVGLGGWCWSWTAVLRGRGVDLGRREAGTVYFAAQLGKYVPGSVWPALIQAAAGRRHGVARRTMLVAYVTWMMVVAATAGVVGAGAVLAEGLGAWRAFVAVIAAGGAAFSGVVVFDRGPAARASDTAKVPVFDRLRSVTALGPHAGTRSVLAATVASIAFGLQSWVLARSLGADFGDLPVVVGGSALAYLAGLAALPLPAGAGVREVVIVAAMAGVLDRPSAVAVALMSRAMTMIAEVILGVMFGVPSARKWVLDQPDAVGPDGPDQSSARSPEDRLSVDARGRRGSADGR